MKSKFRPFLFVLLVIVLALPGAGAGGEDKPSQRGKIPVCPGRR